VIRHHAARGFVREEPITLSPSASSGHARQSVARGFDKLSQNGWMS